MLRHKSHNPLSEAARVRIIAAVWPITRMNIVDYVRPPAARANPVRPDEDHESSQTGREISMSTNFGRRLAVTGLIALLCGAWADAGLARGRRPETIPELNTNRLIIKYPGTGGSTAQPEPIKLSQLRALAAELGISAKHLRRMAHGADVFEL
eukprot:gene58116-77552_t